MMSFYHKVRQDPELGPVFTDAIGNDWDSHIERIIQFWLTATRPWTAAMAAEISCRRTFVIPPFEPLSCRAGSNFFAKQPPSIALRK
jgi:hypothetical protein